MYVIDYREQELDDFFEKDLNRFCEEDLNKYLKEDSEELCKKNHMFIRVEKLKSFALFLAVAVVLILFIGKVLIINTSIPTGSMENTIMSGDRVIGNRLAYKFNRPQRGDIIIFKYPDNPKIQYIKRIIGLPGDTVRILEGKVIVNNEVVYENYLRETPKSESFGPYRVPANRYFVLGDNRNFSEDARYWKNSYVYENQIIAKAEIVYWPRIKKIK